MKLKYALVPVLAVTMVLAGCKNPDGSSDRTGTGALAGAGAGAITGARFGGGGGALIGAAAGLIAGGLIGHVLDEQHQDKLREESPQTYQRVDQNQPLMASDIKALAKTGVSDDVIINQIRNSRTVYHLSSADIIDLKNSGVSDGVINFMINTPTTIGESYTAPLTPQAPGTPALVSVPPPAPQTEAVVVSPGQGFVWVGGEWSWYGRWVWTPGYWGRPPRPNAVWVVGSWSHGPRGWYRVGGYWR